MCSVPVQLNGDVIAAYMSAYGNVKEETIVRSADGTAHGDFVLDICLNKESFQAIPHILIYQVQPLLNFKQIRSKDISNQYLFRGAPMVTNFCSPGRLSRAAELQLNSALDPWGM